MKGMMRMSSLKFEPGDIFISEIFFSDFSEAKHRPVIVISKRNDSLIDTIAVKITKTQRSSKYCVPIEKNDIIDGKLKMKSFAEVNFIATIQKRDIKQKVGRLTPEKLKIIKKKLKDLFDL